MVAKKMANIFPREGVVINIFARGLQETRGSGNFRPWPGRGKTRGMTTQDQRERRWSPFPHLGWMHQQTAGSARGRDPGMSCAGQSAGAVRVGIAPGFAGQQRHSRAWAALPGNAKNPGYWEGGWDLHPSPASARGRAAGWSRRWRPRRSCGRRSRPRSR